MILVLELLDKPEPPASGIPLVLEHFRLMLFNIEAVGDVFVPVEWRFWLSLLERGELVLEVLSGCEWFEKEPVYPRGEGGAVLLLASVFMVLLLC